MLMVDLLWLEFSGLRSDLGLGIFCLLNQKFGRPNVTQISKDRCYDFINIFAEKFGEKIGVFDSKQS
jgi:hypothetical protein